MTALRSALLAALVVASMVAPPALALQSGAGPATADAPATVTDGAPGAPGGTAGATTPPNGSNATDDDPTEGTSDFHRVEDERPVHPSSGGDLEPATHVTQPPAPINVTKFYRLTPSDPGNVTVEVSYEIPEGTDPDAVPPVILPEGERVLAADGFLKDGRNLDWDGRTLDPTATYVLNANETTDESVDAGDWAFVNPASRLEYSPYDVNLTVDADVPHARAEFWLFLGDHRTYEVDGENQTIRVVVPDAADLRTEPETILETLRQASHTLDVEGPQTNVTGIATPDPVRSGGAAGPDGFWVHESSRVDHPENVWIHEYVHTREDVPMNYTDPTTAWLTEALAEYYAALLTVRQGRTSFDRLWSTHYEPNPFERRVVLDDDSTWNRSFYRDPGYGKGMMFLLGLDARIRERTDGEATFMDVFRYLNGAPRGTIEDMDDFADVVAAATGERFDSYIETYGTTGAYPPADPRPEAFDFLETDRITGDVEVRGDARPDNGSVYATRTFRADTEFWLLLGPLEYTIHREMGDRDVDVGDGTVSMTVDRPQESHDLVDAYVVSYAQVGQRGTPLARDGVPDVYPLGVADPPGDTDLGTTRIPRGYPLDVAVLAPNGTGLPETRLSIVTAANGATASLTDAPLDDTGHVRLTRADRKGVELAGRAAVLTSPESESGGRYYDVNASVSMDAPVSYHVVVDDADPVNGSVVTNARPVTGERVEVRLLVADRATGTVPVYADGERVATVDLDDDETTATVTFDDPGTHTLHVADHPVHEVAVENGTPPRDRGVDVTGDGDPSSSVDPAPGHEDVDGDGDFDIFDVQALFERTVGD